MKQMNLLQGKFSFSPIFTSCKMGKDGSYFKLLGLVQKLQNRIHLIHGKTKPVHHGIHFYMDRIILKSFLAGGLHKSFEIIAAIEVGLKRKLDELVIMGGLRMEYHDRRVNTCFSKLYPFTGIR